VSAFKSSRNKAGDLAKLRVSLNEHARKFAESDYAQAVIEELPDGATADRRGQWFWGRAVLVADQPEKIEAGDDQPGLRIGPALQALLDKSESEALLMSPYFVPGDRDEKQLVGLAKRGVAVRVLTNSFASSDEPAVHTGYSGHRRALLAGGVELYELKPEAGVKQSHVQWYRSSGVSLHAKSMVVDRRYVFVGSMNMDQRSKLLNTEMGMIVDSPALAKAVADFFTTVTLPANAYKLSLENPDGTASGSGQILWHTVENGKPVTLTTEPGVGVAKRAELLLLKLLPIDGLL
jgi:putative cardiolipin synthase